MGQGIQQRQCCKAKEWRMEMTKTTTKTRKAAPKAKKLTAAQADVIKSSRGTASGENHVVHAADGRSITFPTARWSGELRDASRVGESFKALDALWNKLSTAKLARGVGGRDAPHSAKSVQDSAAKNGSAGKKAAKAAPKKTAKTDGPDKRKITLTAKGQAQLEANKDNGATRNVKALAKAGTVQAALDAGLKMADVNYAAKVGTITVK
jgi:hypothetical protein